MPEKGSGKANSTDSEAEDAGGAEDDNDAPPNRAQGKKQNIHVQKIKDNQFEGDLPSFLGEWKVNLERTEPIDFIMHLFPEDMLSDIEHNTNLNALQQGKENLALTKI